MNLRIQLLTCAAAALLAASPAAEAQSRAADGQAVEPLSALGYAGGGGTQAKTSRASVEKKQKQKQKQEKAAKASKAKDQVNLYELKELIAGLEEGRAALETIGEEKQAKQMAKLIEKIKAKYEAARAQADRAQARGGRQMGADARGQQDAMDMSDLGRRMRAASVAREFHVEAGWETAARQLGALIECGKLIAAGADGQEIMEVYAGAPGIDARIEMLDRAAAGYKKSGNADRARLCAALSKWYGGKRDTVVPPGTKEAPMRPQTSDAPAAPRQPRRLSLEERSDRIEILGFAREAHLAGGSRRAADQLGALMHLGKLQEAGASSEQLAQATPQNVSMEELVGYVRQAVPVLEKSGQPGKARACRALAEFYTQRDGISGGGSTDRAPGRSGPSTGTFRIAPQPPAPRAPQGAEDLQMRLDALQRQIEELRRSVAEMRGGQRRR